MGQSIHLIRWAKLYSQQTEAENSIEHAVASLGVRYRTQHPFWGLRLFPDVVLLDDKVVIEVDDSSHRKPAKRRDDEERTRKLNSAGFRVVRCWNEEAIEDPYGTVDRLMEELNLPYRTKRED